MAVSESAAKTGACMASSRAAAVTKVFIDGANLRQTEPKNPIQIHGELLTAGWEHFVIKIYQETFACS
jgi:hypothetical protein